MTGAVRIVVGVALVTAVWSEAAQAQVIGTFRWQMLPYCNVVTLTVVQTGSTFALHGHDDQCSFLGAGVTGVAFAPTLSQVTVAFDTVYNLVGGSVTSIHTDASINLSTLSGTWHDTLGRTGSFTFTPGAAVPGGSARPRTKRVSLGTFGTNVTIAPHACTVHDIANAAVAAGDLIIPTPLSMPAGLYVLPVVAGANGRYGVMYCNGTNAQVTSVFATVGIAREPQ